MTANSPDERVIIVDEHDRPIGSMLRKDRTPSDIYRVAAVWLTNSSGQVLLTQRSLTKDRGAGQWGPAAAGTVAVGESYLENITRETEEEIGLSGIEFKPGPKIYLDTGKYRNFTQFFMASADLPVTAFKPDPDEVRALEWVDAGTLSTELEQLPKKFVPNSIYWKGTLLP